MKWHWGLWPDMRKQMPRASVTEESLDPAHRRHMGVELEVASSDQVDINKDWKSEG